MFRIGSEKLRHSNPPLKNIEADKNFHVEDMFKNMNCDRNLSREFLQQEKNYIEKRLGESDSAQAIQFYYSYYNEFMGLEDFLEFYHKYLNKRKLEMEKIRYKRKFMSEVDNIKNIKTKRFVEMEK